MKRIAGEQLADVWPTMSAEAKSNNLRQLKPYLSELHNLRPDGAGWIGSCSQGPAYDHRLDNRATCGPFASVSELNDYLVEPVKQCARPDFVVKYRQRLPDTNEIHFAHADLSGENILLDAETSNVNGIIDWEMAGFWPAWWEYRKALSGARP